MKSITIHDLDLDLYQRLTETAKRQGLSLNKTIKHLLENSLGKKDTPNTDHREDFREFFGIWSEMEANTFTQSIHDFEQIPPNHW